MRANAAHVCANCGLSLPKQRKQYAELCGGWAVEHDAGGAHSVHAPHWTGRVLCELCFRKQRPRPITARLRDTCDDCSAAPVSYRQLAHGWTRLPKMNAVFDARYSALALCERCFIKRIEGEQLRLFDA
jgi:hypothetical protein